MTQFPQITLPNSLDASTLTLETPHQLDCLDVWGGSLRINRQAYVTGMKVWVNAAPATNDRGGDLYLVSMCGGAKISRYLLADVSGHDDAAADVADDFRKLLRKHINKQDQTKLARALNRDFEKQELGGRFVTALLATFIPTSQHLILCNAGHPRPLHYHAAEKSWSFLDAEHADDDVPRNLPIGVIPETDYVQFAQHVAPGDLLFCYTDGVTEARPQGGRMLGEAGLLEMVKTLNVTEPHGLLEQLNRRLHAFTGGQMDHDDVTMMLLCPDGVMPHRQPLGKQLKVLGRMVGLYGN
jgi:serine phosphatase RsbU (regulator of sigma subunit)